MIFSDPVFLLVFLPITVLLHRLAVSYSEAAAQWVLVAASLVFYGAWDVRWVPLLVGTIAANLVIGRCLIEDRSRLLLWLGLLVNLIPLFVVKYAGWLSGGRVFSDIVLPLGISFFTFQQIGFLVDAYRGRVERMSVRHYTLFVTFFTQLIAGPICHWKALTEQFKRKFSLSPELLTTALVLIAVGLFKKAVIADRLAPYAEAVFDGGGVVTIYEAWVGSLAYTFQLFFDFAGYCEMAMGFALLFGYKIPINFSSPYKSLSITEFWRRWHTTLGLFFRNYVYIPLGGNRNGVSRMYMALFATAFVSGLWHGAGLTFVIWGVMHGSALVVEKYGSRLGVSMPTTLRLVLTFSFVSLAWVMFRAPDVSTAINVYGSLIGMNGFVPPPLFAYVLNYTGVMLGNVTGFELFFLLGLLWWVWTKPNVHEMKFETNKKALATMSAATAMILFSITSPSAFIYFNF